MGELRTVMEHLSIIGGLMVMAVLVNRRGATAQ